MPLLPKQRSSFKTSPRPAQPNLESHLTAPSPQQRAFLRPAQAKYTKKSLKYTKRVDINLHNWCNLSIAAITTTHPSPVNTGANTINANAPLASRECSRGCKCDGRHGIDRVRPGLSKVACPCRSLHPRGASPGSIAPAGMAAALRGTPAVTSRQRAYTVKRVRRMRPRARTATPVGIPAPPSSCATGQTRAPCSRALRFERFSPSQRHLLPPLHFLWHACKGIGSFFTVCATQWLQPPISQARQQPLSGLFFCPQPENPCKQPALPCPACRSPARHFSTATRPAPTLPTPSPKPAHASQPSRQLRPASHGAAASMARR